MFLEIFIDTLWRKIMAIIGSEKTKILISGRMKEGWREGIFAKVSLMRYYSRNFW